MKLLEIQLICIRASTVKSIRRRCSECVLGEIFGVCGSYLAHAPLSLLHAVYVLPLAGRHGALLLHAHVAAVGQGHARHRGPSSHHGGGWDGPAQPWRETLRSELHLGLAQVHACWSKEKHRASLVYYSSITLNLCVSTAANNSHFTLFPFSGKQSAPPFTGALYIKLIIKSSKGPQKHSNCK